ncbi:COX1 oxidase, partial [Acromyrmex heyeri]
SGIIESAISMLIRLELRSYRNLINNDQIYNSLITNHAFIIILFIIVFFIIVDDRKFLIPLILGSPDIYLIYVELGAINFISIGFIFLFSIKKQFIINICFLNFSLE